MAMSGEAPFSAWSSDGVSVAWDLWDGTPSERLEVRWQNEAWTVEGVVAPLDIQYVIRLTASFRPSQFLLFRDLDEPDLWLATDGSGRWGEMNGAHRTDLDGCTDIALACTPFSHSMPIRRLPLAIGHTARISVAMVDPETLAVVPVAVQYTRSSAREWTVDRFHGERITSTALTVDAQGIVVEEVGRYRRSTNDDSQVPNAAP
jgi:uncharacterized protein